MPYCRIFEYLFLLAAMPLLVGCGNELPQENRPSLVEIGGTRLYKDEVDLLFAASNHSDSAKYVDEYIEHWATEQLFYNKAAENVVSTAEIEKMIESYRKSLILNIYQEKLIDQQLRPSISQDEVSYFYNANKQLFDADESLFKGFLLVLPAKTPNLNKVRKWCLEMKPESMEELDAYSADNAITYEYLMDRWHPITDVVKHIPLTEPQLLERLSRKSSIEFRDGNEIYFVCSDTILYEGDAMPIELVSAEINELLLNSKKADFIKRKKKDLYEEAKAKGAITINNQQIASDQIIKNDE